MSFLKVVALLTLAMFVALPVPSFARQGPPPAVELFPKWFESDPAPKAGATSYKIQFSGKKNIRASQILLPLGAMQETDGDTNTLTITFPAQPEKAVVIVNILTTDKDIKVIKEEWIYPK
jgi:hypothetical protein